MTAIKWQIYEPAKATVTRIIPELAVEIGLNESIVLLQIAFWISISNNERDGIYWTYQTLAEMKEKAFTYWSIDTIRRIVHKLESEGFIIVRNYNKQAGDNTQWFALEPEKLSQLKSILIQSTNHEDAEKTPLQVATPPLQLASTPLQNARSITREYTENTTEPKKKRAPKGAGGYPSTLSRWKNDHFEKYYADHTEPLTALCKADGLDLSFMPWKNLPMVTKRGYITTLQEMETANVGCSDYEAIFKFTRERWKDAPQSEVVKNIPKWKMQQANRTTEDDKEAEIIARAKKSMELSKMAFMEAQGLV